MVTALEKTVSSHVKTCRSMAIEMHDSLQHGVLSTKRR